MGTSPGAEMGSKDPVAAGLPLSRAQQLPRARHGLQRDPTLGRAEPGAMLGGARGGSSPVPAGSLLGLTGVLPARTASLLPGALRSGS